MSIKIKKILVVILFMASVFGIATALYFMFFRPAPPPATVLDTDITIPSGAGGALPSTQTGAPTTFEPTGVPAALTEAEEIARGGVTQVTELTTSRVEEIVASASGSTLQYYDPSDGRFYAIDENGNVARLSDKQFLNAEEIDWNKDSDKAIIEFPDGSNVVYDFNSESQVTLPKHWEEFEFSPTQNEIAAKSIALDPNNRWLILSSDDGTKTEAIQPLGENADKVQVSWSPNDQVVAFSDTAQPITGGLDRKMIIPIGKNKENFKGLIVEGLGFDSKWSPNGKQLLYSVAGSYSEYKPLLWIVDATSNTMGENRKSLGLNTWVEKCTFANQSTIYCAVPKTINPNVGLLPSLAKNVPDSLYKIDLSTGQTSLVAIPVTEKTITNLTVSADESNLYFTNAKNGRLDLIKLK